MSVIRAIVFDCFGVLYIYNQAGDLVRNQELLGQIVELKKRYKIGLLTNMLAGKLDKYFTREEQTKYFDAIITSGDTGLTKPQPEAYQAICQRLGVKPQECLMIDDSPALCQAAEEVGMKVLEYNGAGQLTQII